MKSNYKHSLTSGLLALVISLNSAYAEDKRGMMKTSQNDAPSNIIAAAANAYKTLQNTQSGVPQSILSKAQCIAIIPQTVTAAVVVGGTHGDGVATCKVNGKWTSPAFVDLNGASLGAQLGGKSSDIVLYFTNTSSVEALKRGKIEFGADASVVAGNFDRAFDTGQAGVVAYENASGAYIGASINGGQLSNDQDSNKSFYGKEVNNKQILGGEETTSSRLEAAKTLISQLPV